MAEIGSVTVDVKVEPTEEFDAAARALGYAKERTCRNEADALNEREGFETYDFVCSECGYNELKKDADRVLCLRLFDLNYCRMCGARVEGAVEVAEHAQACGTCGSFRRCCGCGSGWCMELMRPVRDDEAACEEHDPDAGGRSRG